MTMIRKLMPATVTVLGDDEVEVRVSTAIRARDGHILIPQGAKLDNYRRNPVVLWNHDTDLPPVGRSEDLRIEGEQIISRVKFPPASISARADEIRGLTKGGFINAVSVGFDPIDGDPIDATKPRAGMQFTEWELLEFSFCNVPIDAEALVTARAKQTAKPGAADEATDGQTGAEGAAATQERAIIIKHRRTLERVAKVPTFKRGLYEVARLADILSSVGYCTDMAEWEAEIEEDDSQVPAMLGAALKQLGEALIAMTQEEVAELLAMHDEEEGGEGSAGERSIAPRIRVWRDAVAQTRAGKAISASNAEKLEEAMGHHDRAMKHHRAMAEHHSTVGEHIESHRAAHEKAVKSHGDLGEALAAAKDEPEKSAEHVSRALKAHRALGGHHESMADVHANMNDAHQDMADSHAAMGRSMKSLHRCVRAVVESSAPGGEESKEVQTSTGTDESTGSEGARRVDRLSKRRREADLLALAIAP